MQIPRYFTGTQENPAENLPEHPPERSQGGPRFEERSSKITNADGSVVSEMDKVVVPEGWSQVAVDILAQKYFRKAGVPVKTRRKMEEGVPEWLCPSEPDDSAMASLAESERFKGKTIRDNCSTVWRVAGLTGAGKRAFFPPKPMLKTIMTRCSGCWRRRAEHRIRRNGSTPG